MKLSIDIENTSLHGLRRACLFECDMFAEGWEKKKEGLGWAFFLASLSSLGVESFSPSPSLRAAGPRSGNKTG